MRRIFKYSLNNDGSIDSIVAPIVRTLKIKMQNGVPVLWAEIDENMEPFELLIIAIGTGWAVSDAIEDWRYIGTVIDNDDLVWHYFGKIADEESDDPIRDAWLSLLDDSEIMWS